MDAQACLPWVCSNALVWLASFGFYARLPYAALSNRTGPPLRKLMNTLLSIACPPDPPLRPGAGF